MFEEVGLLHTYCIVGFVPSDRHLSQWVVVSPYFSIFWRDFWNVSLAQNQNYSHTVDCCVSWSSLLSRLRCFRSLLVLVGEVGRVGLTTGENWARSGLFKSCRLRLRCLATGVFSLLGSRLGGLSARRLSSFEALCDNGWKIRLRHHGCQVREWARVLLLLGLHSLRAENRIRDIRLLDEKTTERFAHCWNVNIRHTLRSSPENRIEFVDRVFTTRLRIQ